MLNERTTNTETAKQDLTHFNQCCISYRHQSFDSHCKSAEWFPYEMHHWAQMGYTEMKFNNTAFSSKPLKTIKF